MRFIITFFILFSSFCNAQTISGRVIDEKTGMSIADVSVFFDNSTISTLTGTDGTFLIQIPDRNNNTLVFSIFGYEYYVLKNPISQQNLKIALKLEDNELDEIVIDNTLFSRKEMLKTFKYFFIGNTDNAKKTKILNEKDISFYYDKKDKTFYASSSKPLSIENKNLGYKILFHLDNFEVAFKTLSIAPQDYVNSHFFGYMQYQDLAKNSKKTLDRREVLYSETYTSFFKKLAQKQLEDSNFVLAANGFQIDQNEFFDIKETEDGYNLKLLKRSTRKKPIISKKAIINGVFNLNDQTEYTEEEVPFVVLNTKTKQQSQLYFQKQDVDIDIKGNLKNPVDVLFSGYFGDLKVADMLPLDFISSNKDVIKKEEVKVTEEMLSKLTYEDFEKEAVDFYTSKDYVSHVKARKRFFDKLKVKYNDKVHEPFVLWIDTNLKSTLFTSKEEAITLHDNFVSTYKVIKNRQNNIGKKEDHFREIYGEKKFDEMYSKAILGGIISGAEFPKPK